MEDDHTRIMIVSQNKLFREGLRRLLADAPNVELLGAVSSLTEAEVLATLSPPDVIIASWKDKGDDQPALSRLLDLALVQVVALRPDGREADIYSRRGGTVDSVEDLLNTWQKL